MLWLAAALLLSSDVTVGPPPEEGQVIAWGRRRRCSGAGTSCTPGPCCRGTTCVDGVCKAPEKKWDDGPNPNEPTPDNPRPLKSDVKAKGKAKPVPAAE